MTSFGFLPKRTAFALSHTPSQHTKEQAGMEKRIGDLTHEVAEERQRKGRGKGTLNIQDKGE